MPELTSKEDVARWLAGKPRDVAVVFVTRAALRVIPVLASTFGLHGREVNKTQRDTVLRTFRCAAAAWAAAAFPGYAPDLMPAAAVAGSRSDDRTASTESAVAWAAAAAGASDSGNFASHAVTYTIEAAAAGGRQPFDDILSSYAADAAMLDQRTSPVTLALSSTLWPNVPDWAFEAWAELERALLDADEDWEVWTDWYEARLKGGPADQVLEVARATIPNDMWEQGPKAVNAEIRRMFEEREIWRYGTADEIEREPADVAPEVPAADNVNDLERRLAALSFEEASVIGARVALRAVPLLKPGPAEFGVAFLSMLRSVSLAWAAAEYPTRAAIRARSVSAYAEASKSRVAIVRAIAGATIAPAANSMAESVFRAIARGIDALRSAAIRSDGVAAGSVFDLVLSQDLNDFSGAPSTTAVAELPLWPGGSPPEWMERRWITLKRDLIKVGVGWEYWVDWYENRLSGRVRSEGRELAYVEVPVELWADGAARVNTWIIKRIEEIERQTISSGELSRGEQAPAESYGLPDVDAIPLQAKAATQFGPNAEGRIDLVPDPPGHAALVDAIQREHYQETRLKTIYLANLGHNQLADLAGTVDRFLSAAPEPLEAVSINRLWSRGNTLRRRLKAHDAAERSFDPTDPARLAPLVAEMLRDLVETYNVFIIGDPKGRELDQVRLGPQERDAAKAVVDAAVPIVGAILVSEGIVTSAAAGALTEQIELASDAPAGVDGDQAIVLAGKTSGNFVSEMLRIAYAPIRKLIAGGKGEAGFAWKEMRAGTYRAAGPSIAGGAILYNQEIIAFIVENGDKLKVFVTQAFQNPALTHIIDVIVQSATLGL